MEKKNFMYGTAFFAILQACVFLVFALAYYFFNGIPSGLFGKSFAMLFMPGISFQFAFVLFLLLLPFAFIASKSRNGYRIMISSCTVTGALFNIVLMTDLFVYGQYHFHINLAMLRLFFGPARREIFDFPALMYIFFFLAIIAVAAGTYALALYAFKRTAKGKTIAIVSAALLMIFAAYNVMYAYSKYVFVPQVLNQTAILPMAYPLSMNSRMRKMGFKPNSAEFEAPSTGSFSYPLEELSFEGTSKKNILLIAADAMRFDMFSPEIMPNTYSAVQKHGFFIFKNHISGGNATTAGIISMFYSLPFSYWDSLSGIPPVLMKTAADKDYDFGIFSSSRLDSPDFTRNVFYGIRNLRIGSQGNNSAERDANARDDFFTYLDRLKENKQGKFFSFIFLDSPHAYSMPEDYKRPFEPSAKSMNYMILNNGTDPKPWLNLYKNSVHYTDSVIGSILSRVEKEGLLKDTIIIITADHGQELNESRQNRWGHNSDYSDWQMKVPMLVYVPGISGREIDYATAHYDIVPTLMRRAFGCTTDSYAYSMGRDMINGYDDEIYGGKGRPYTVIANYTAKAVKEGDFVSEFSNYGTINHFDRNAQPQKQGASPYAIKNALKDFARFYK